MKEEMQALSRFVSCTCLPLHEDSLVSSGSSGTWFLVFAIDHNNTILCILLLVVLLEVRLLP